jgi:Fur family ferric uptake transcriptional regulator
MAGIAPPTAGLADLVIQAGDMSHPGEEQVLRRQIAVAGGKVTRPRVETLRVLQSVDRAMTHAEVQERLPDLDRVTLYRTLEWLVSVQLAHHLTDANGLRRFSGRILADDHLHAHFQCDTCGSTTCLDTVAVPEVTLPTGFASSRVEMLVRGQCRRCMVLPDLGGVARRTRK